MAASATGMAQLDLAVRESKASVDQSQACQTETDDHKL
jgi:hypothetical protein